MNYLDLVESNPDTFLINKKDLGMILIHYGFTLLNTVSYLLQNQFIHTFTNIVSSLGSIHLITNSLLGMAQNGIRFNCSNKSIPMISKISFIQLLPDASC